MLPFFTEFDKGEQIELRDVPIGGYAIILSIVSQRALLVRVARHEAHDWIGGAIVAPAMFPHIADTFTRKGTTLAVRVAADEVLDLAARYGVKIAVSEHDYLIKTEENTVKS
jgi:hypothetical protein